MTKTKFGTFDELMEQSTAEMRPIAVAARKLILDVHPDATEVVRLGDRGASYGLGPKKMSEAHTYIVPQTSHVNVGFFYGARLPDPGALLEGTGKEMRHVKVRSVADVARCRPLIEAALAERKKSLGRG